MAAAYFAVMGMPALRVRQRQPVHEIRKFAQPLIRIPMSQDTIYLKP